MNESPRLIEVAFPLKQASLDSVHEKNVRQGHISTLHIWPARRPLAACRATLVCTLLPDPGNERERKEILERLAGQVVQKVKRKRLSGGKVEEKVVEETEGGILRWGRESGPEVEWFRQKIQEAYGGRAPKVLDPFAGGGSIPLEAMRLGCAATAVDINPVAWFVLKCTLEYPQKLAGQTRPLPKFATDSPEFMEEYRKARDQGPGAKGQRKRKASGNAAQGHLLEVPQADLAWHVRAWGWWVLQRASADLERFYPNVDGKPTIAYLWARTVRCKNCRSTLPLLKTRWLCKKDRKRVVLTMKPNADRTGVVFGIREDVPIVGGNAAQRREYDRKVGAGTMSRSGATCPCCGTIMTMEDLRLEGQAARLGTVLTAVVVDGPHGKEYRLPAEAEIGAAEEAPAELERIFAEVPFGLPTEPLPSKEALGFRVPLYGIDRWYKLFTPRQLAALGTFLTNTRTAREAMISVGYSSEWVEAVVAYLACVLSRTADYLTLLCVWEHGAEEVKHTFMRWALPITWDFAEANPIGPMERFFFGGLLSVCRVISAIHQTNWRGTEAPTLHKYSASELDAKADLVFTDPPYYDAIPYADLMDFFYVWLRRTLNGLSHEIDAAFREPLSPKWDHDKNDGELIDDASRHGGDHARSRAAYEEGMCRALTACWRALDPQGRLVLVFANKNPAAWEALASAAIRAGFCVTGSWPIVTEMPGGLRNLNRASLASSVWLAGRKRSEGVRAGWDNVVLDEMREKIQLRLREFWDAGIRGPDFVWAATGPALEAYSKHPVVKKADSPGEVMTVPEFLGHVRRVVVEFVVGRVLSHNGEGEDAAGLDDVTTYYLLHRHDFSMEEAPVGTCILYAISCGLSDTALADQYDILIRAGGRAADEEEADEETEDGGDEEPPEGSGSKVRLRPWQQRKRKTMGYEAPGGRSIPLIDQVHRLMHLWKAGDVTKVDDYLDVRGLRQNALFHKLLQALIELAPHGSEERSLLESISNHVAARGRTDDRQQTLRLEV